MKKRLLTLAIIGITAATYAQSVNFGIKGGLNLSNQVLTDNSLSVNSASLLPGYHIGIIADVGFKNLSVQPGVLFTTKGEKLNYQLLNFNQQPQGGSDLNIVLNYIEVPVNVLYHIPVAPKTQLHIGAGAYLAYGVSAHSTYNGTTHAFSFNGNLADGGYKNPDYGVNFVAGIKVTKLFFDASYSLGLADINSTSNTLKNRVLGFSVGCFIK